MFEAIPCFMAFVLLSFKVYSRVSVGMCKSTRRIDGRVVIITGTNTGLGYETAKDLARRGGKIIMACKDMRKATKACERLKREVPEARLVPMALDLAEMNSIRQFCDNFLRKESRLDLLVNNAGVGFFTEPVPLRNSEGHELHMATNHLGHFLLTNILLDIMIKSGGGRIINVSSVSANHYKQFDLENLNSEKKHEKFSSYIRSKLCNVYFTNELDFKLRAKGLSPNKISTFVLHPGMANTDFFRYKNRALWFHILMTCLKFFMKTPFEGAQTQIYCAVSEELDGQSGGYYLDCKKIRTSKIAEDKEVARGLWEKSEKLVNLKKKEFHL